mmetsp:Transcript_3327/g.7642  ORF Transcript_3327/g.7642 Transcript_3327/m.7642 type:complete len:103 (-) Transcript_3327:1686-1994(-)
MVERRCAMTRRVRFWPRASKASWMLFSVMLSRALVASSSSTIGGFFSKQRAIATRCFSPPDSLSPLSPTRVSHFSGRDSTKVRICAASAAACTSSKEASSLP